MQGFSYESAWKYLSRKKGDIVVQSSSPQFYWLTQISKRVVCSLSLSLQDEVKEGMQMCNWFIYLPVSSFEHHSKGSVSNQIFSAVLKISHSFHCEGPMVQLGTVGFPWMTLSSLEEKKIPGQAIDRVLMMLLLLALRNYFMTGCSGVRYCINKRCSQDMMHSHALQAGWDVCNITNNGRL